MPAQTSLADPQDRPALGILLMLSALFVLACMDAVAKHLTETLLAPQILAVRFWIFFLFAMALTGRAGGPRLARSRRPWLQIVRALVLTVEMTIFIVAFCIIVGGPADFTTGFRLRSFWGVAGVSTGRVRTTTDGDEAISTQYQPPKIAAAANMSGNTTNTATRPTRPTECACLA